MTTLRFRQLRQRVQLEGNEDEHEQTDRWSNRDLIPLPPSRRTWGWFNYFGYWTLSSLNVSNWQTPNTFLSFGLSVGQSMMVIVIGRALVTLFSTLVAWAGLKWHIGFTIQNRYSWGMRGSWIPLLQRILLSFIWCAIQCWNGGRLFAVCITAIWPSFAKIPNTLPSSMPTTTYQFVGFIVFWVASVPFLFIRPEKFRLPFLVTSLWCGVGMISMLIWSLSVAKGAGPLMHTGVSVPQNSTYNTSWLIMRGIDSMIGNIVAGITNTSDFSRYSRGPKDYIIGTVASAWITGVLVSVMGLIVTSACQSIYGEVYWNPPDLLMRMMDSGHGSSAARAGVFFLAFGFALTAMFENVCGNAVAGGIDLAGLFPRYIDIRRGAFITFIAVWICQPWQLVNAAATFVQVLSSFSVFLSPILGIMVVDFYLLRKTKIQLSHLYRTNDTNYWFTKGVNWRAVPAWIGGWAPTIGGLVVTVGEVENPSTTLVKLYYMAFLVGFFVSGTIFYALSVVFPCPGMGEYDFVDVYGTFSAKEAEKMGVEPLDEQVIEGTEYELGSKRPDVETVVEKS